MNIFTAVMAVFRSDIFSLHRQQYWMGCPLFWNLRAGAFTGLDPNSLRLAFLAPPKP